MVCHVLCIERPAGELPSVIYGAFPPAVQIRTESIPWSAALPRQVAATTADLIIAIVGAAAADAMRLFGWLREHAIRAPLVAVLPADCPEPLMAAAADVSDDFLLMPARPGELSRRVSRVLGLRGDAEEGVREQLLEEAALARLVGKAPAFVDALHRLITIARSGRSVVITGETGTGKELCARAVHHLGRRRAKPFVAVDCGALPEQLFENELFGHARGAFTDARATQPGLVAIAEGGTLFLDEVDALSHASQAKLLRFLQDRSYRPLGSDRFVVGDVTVVSATNQDLETLVRERRFRADLYFRLNVLRLHLPALRDRREDIPLLARHFLDALSAESQSGRRTLTPPALRRLLHYHWPGNVRELFNVMQSAFVFAEGPLVLPEHCVLREERAEGPAGPAGSWREARAEALNAFERHYAEELLRRTGGNITHAAAEAQKDRRAFGRLVKKHGLDRRAWQKQSVP